MSRSNGIYDKPLGREPTRLEPPSISAMSEGSVTNTRNTATASVVREFSSGATRDTATGKHDFEGYLSPLVLNRFAEYMTKHREQNDGSLRASDNWQKGIPQDQYMKSAWRHFIEWWTLHRTPWHGNEVEEALCALMFNIMGYLHEHLKKKKQIMLKEKQDETA